MVDSKAFNAESFRAQTGKPASPSQYLVTLSKSPNIMGGLFKELKLSMAAQAAEIPARQLDVLERRYNGPVRNVPVGHTYSTMNVEYFENAEYDVRNYFNTWQDRIFKETDTWKVPYYEDIICPWIDIDLFSPDGRKMSTYRIYEVFPIAISSTQLGWGLSNQSMTTNIEFSYHRWEEVEADRSPVTKKLPKQKTSKGVLKDLKSAKAAADSLKGGISTLQKIKNTFGSFVRTVKTIKSNIDFVKKSIKDVRNIVKQIKSLRVNTRSLGGFVSSLENIGNVSSSIDRRINNFGSGVQKVSTSSKEIFNKFTK